MRFAIVLGRTAIIFQQNIDILVFITEIYFHCAVRAGYLNGLPAEIFVFLKASQRGACKFSDRTYMLINTCVVWRLAACYIFT